MYDQQVKFVIQSVDTTRGECVVQYINPYGPIALGTKTLDDFTTAIQVPTGNYQADGTPITTTTTVTVDNPNDDVITSVTIPTVNGEFPSKEHLLHFITSQYPVNVFEKKRQLQLSQTVDYSSLVNSTHNASVVFAPISADLVNGPGVPESDVPLVLSVINSVTVAPQ